MLIPVSKFAKEFHISPATVREKIRSGEWPAYKLGRKSLRVDANEIKRIARKAARKNES